MHKRRSVITIHFSKEEAGNRFDAEREKDQNDWTAGRLTSQLRKAEEEAQRTKRIAARIEAEKNAAAAQQAEADAKKQ